MHKQMLCPCSGNKFEINFGNRLYSKRRGQALLFPFVYNLLPNLMSNCNHYVHGLRTPREEIAFTAMPKINSHSQAFRYGRSIFCLPHRPKFSDFFDLCFRWVSVVCDYAHG